jgi:hypothetical protein
LLSAIGCQADYDDTRSNSDERATKNILTILKYFSIDWIKKTCWKEIVNLAGYDDYHIEAVEASDNSISGMLQQQGICTVVIKVIWHYFHCKTARVASGENSLSLMLYLYLLTYLLALWPASSQKFFREEKYLLTNSQVAELWKIREHKFKHYSNTNK